MNSNDNFSSKKKKDLVAIALHFGLLTESKANSMSKQNLVDFFLEQERLSMGAEVSEPQSQPAVSHAPEPIPAEPAEPEGENDPQAESEEEPIEPIHQDLVKPAAKTRRRSSSNKKTTEKPVVPEGVDPSGTVPAESIDLDPEPLQENTVSDISDLHPETAASDGTAEPSFEGRDREEGGSRSTPPADGSGRKRTSRSKKRSIIIQPKNGSGLPTDDDYPPDDGDYSEGSETTDGPDTESQDTDKSAGSVRTLRHKTPEAEMITGILEIMPEGFGFIRRENYLPSASDIFVHSNYIRRFGLRTGDCVTGPVRPKKESDKYAPIQYIKEVNDLPPEKMQRRAHFDRLTPIYPEERFVLETEKTELSTRIIDLIAPIGKGQRGMIVSPPKAGKTILLQKIANAISTNNPNAKLIVLLIDERPEEVTDMQRSINGEVVYSTFDKKPENHTKIVELVLERAMRLVELENDVVILLDSMTRLSRAYNLTINPTGRTLSGGLDPGALYGPKRLFGAARNIENGGSLTIIATSLIETGSRMDEVIFEEFKGTGNMEVYLDRKLSEKRIFPAIDINKSGTRREELLLGTTELDAVWTIRKAFSQLDTSAVTEMIISLLMKTQTNAQFIQSVNVSFSDKAVFEAMRGTRPAGTNTVTNGNSNGK
ncbi:MAG: transcription termination factor Rho [Clostridiales bacterium]|nr:transcription termination factor Rho [Clostridiales bacterium]